MERPSISEHFAAEALQQGFKQGFKQGFEQGFEQGFKQGARERALKDILEVLTLRLKPYAATVFKATLETIDDLDRLAQLHRAAILAETLDDFAQVLTENRN
jgi:flagellar biosynthesis/type III secretory pathway protein FliH